MTYDGPNRRSIPDDFHDNLAKILREVTSAEVKAALAPIGLEVTRLRRVIEGENGGSIFSVGVVGAMEKVIATDTAHNTRLNLLEQRWDRFRWTVTGAALGGGLAGGGLSAIIIDAIKGSG